MIIKIYSITKEKVIEAIQKASAEIAKKSLRNISTN